jgi:hypothetical protein
MCIRVLQTACTRLAKAIFYQHPIFAQHSSTPTMDKSPEENKACMYRGENYNSNYPDLFAERQNAKLLLRHYNNMDLSIFSKTQEQCTLERQAILQKLREKKYCLTNYSEDY